jgi:transposase
MFCCVIEDLVPDSLWERVAPLLPARPTRRLRLPGRKRVDDRAALVGIVFVLKTGITWNQFARAGGRLFGRDLQAPSAGLD